MNIKKIILIVVFAVLLRLVGINQSLWLDEGAQVMMSSNPVVYQLVGRSDDFHPPLFYVLIHFWMKINSAEWFLRIPSLVFAVATIIFVYRWVLKVFGEKTATIASLFLCISPFLIYYSQEVRMYTLLALLATLSMIFLWENSWLGYIAVTSAMLFTHYAGFIVLATQVIWFIFNDKKRIGVFIENCAIVLLLFIFWVPQFLKQLEAGKTLITVLPAWTSLASLSVIKAIPVLLFKFSLGRITVDNKVIYSLIVLGIIAFLLLLLRKYTRKLDKIRIYLLFWFTVPVVLTLLVSFFSPMFQPFRLIYAIIPFYLFMAVAVNDFTNEKIRKGLIFIVVSVSLSGLIMYDTNPKFQREDWRRATNFVEFKDPAKSVVLFEFSSPPASYSWYTKNRVGAYGVIPGLVANQDLVSKQIVKAVSGKEDVYLFQYLQPLVDPEKIVEKWLVNNGYFLNQTYDFTGVGFVYNYKYHK